MAKREQEKYTGKWSGWKKHRSMQMNTRVINDIQHALVAEKDEANPDATHVHYMLDGSGRWLVASVKINSTRVINRARFLRKINNLFGGKSFFPSAP